mgnify:CR=1 FL=1
MTFLINYKNQILTAILIIAGLFAGDILHVKTIGLASLPANLGTYIMFGCFFGIFVVWFEKLQRKDIPETQEEYTPPQKSDPFHELLGRMK